MRAGASGAFWDKTAGGVSGPWKSNELFLFESIAEVFDATLGKQSGEVVTRDDGHI